MPNNCVFWRNIFCDHFYSWTCGIQHLTTNNPKMQAKIQRQRYAILGDFLYSIAARG